MADTNIESSMAAVQASPKRARRLWGFVALCVAAALLAGGYSAIAARRGSRAGRAGLTAMLLPTPPVKPLLMVRSTASDDTWGRLMLVPLSAPAGLGYATTLECERAYYAGNRGVCLVREAGITSYSYYADVFDDRFTRVYRLPLTGVPSRTRVSVDGRRAGITVFEHGHSYAEEGFSTRTTIVDTIRGRMIGDLEQYTIWRDGERFHAVDFNFWGVTFAQDGNRFFATLASGGKKYLIEGNVDAREGHVVRTDVECPSLSPDNTRIAYKHMFRRDGMWQLRVYDLRTATDTALTPETRSVDDQVDWLDNDHVMYHITGSRGADIWVLRTDGIEPPQMLRQYAYSPAAVR